MSTEPPHPASGDRLLELWREIERDLRRLLAQADDRLDPATVLQIEEFLDHNELGVAAEGLAYSLSQALPPTSDRERETLRSLGARMDLDLAEWEELGLRERPPSP